MVTFLAGTLGLLQRIFVKMYYKGKKNFSTLFWMNE